MLNPAADAPLAPTRQVTRLALRCRDDWFKIAGMTTTTYREDTMTTPTVRPLHTHAATAHPSEASMRLVYLTANAAWTFTFCDQLLRMEDDPMFFHTRGDAVESARRCGLSVSRSGVVTSC